MSASSLDFVAQKILEHYPAPLQGPLAPLGNHGGFSGARLWKVGDACLRAWPAEGPSSERLRWIHRLMKAARNSGLPYVPAVLATSADNSCVEYANRCWDLTSWQPGCADFHASPTAQRLDVACTALAQIHLVWSNLESGFGPCPAVHRRLQRFAQWQKLLQSGWRPTFSAHEADPVVPWATRGWEALQSRMHRLPGSLLGWMEESLPHQPCLCDIWHDHVLFQGEAVTGLIDYGSTRRDHVATDLARLLGSLVGDDARQWQAGLAAYAEHRRLSSAETELARVLDEAGTLLGVANWLRWLYHEKRPYADRPAVARRLSALVERIERWP